jgi:hypothetical protein
MGGLGRACAPCASKCAKAVSQSYSSERAASEWYYHRLLRLSICGAAAVLRRGGRNAAVTGGAVGRAPVATHSDSTSGGYGRDGEK